MYCGEASEMKTTGKGEMQGKEITGGVDDAQLRSYYEEQKEPAESTR